MDTEFILDQMQATAEPFALCQLRGECELGLGKDPVATLHYVLAGRGEIVLPGQPAIPLRPGSLALIPALSAHSLRSFGALSDPVPVCRPASLQIAHVMHGDSNNEGDELIAICARISLSLRSLHNLIDLVHTPIVEEVEEETLLALPVKGILRELSNPGPGSKAMIRTLLLVSAIEMMRRRLSAKDDNLGWMSALRDPKLWPVLRRMLDAPGDRYSLESLAELAGMSRSAFAKRFAEAYGRGPMELLRALRMQRAATRLIETDTPIKRIAELSGFQSRSAFTRAFEAVTGLSPQQFRSSNHR